MKNPLHDDAPSLLLRGYDFADRIWNRVAPGARSAPMRLLGDDALFVRGAEGVRLFYDDTLIARHGAMPAIVQETLFGHGSVHSLDGAQHRHRKDGFVSAAYEDSQVERLAPLLDREWRSELHAWIDGGQRTAYEAAVGAFGRASMRWAGLPGTAAAKTRWAQRLAQIVDGFGAPYSPAYAMAAANRWWSDRHSRRLIEAVRSGTLHPAEHEALAIWAGHRDPDGRLLPAQLAGVELQNSIRPMIAVARFVAFAGQRLHKHPQWRERIADEVAARGSLVGGPLAVAFAQEVRRTALFVPMLPGRAIADIDFDGLQVAAGGRVVLDILGTDLDENSWDDATRFAPDRFIEHPDYESLPAFVPHGGGSVTAGHRCPGEKLAIAGLAAAVAAMSDPGVTILGTGLGVNRRRLPTMPASGVHVARAGAASRCPVH
ncbi:cytochrome P450 [Microbacterium sp. M28]|uniref:cytochrome P450 n=1 Tax=Microbacterium sp. M28 TaxID=2962064 RepID=UPI0021F4EDA6|nr:cytochrome P450 [Microbacterium sp. M28]UYO98589.1 cytochrome P450 [Microbacterium sp. M28]